MENKKLYGLLCCLHRQMRRDNQKLFFDYGITPVHMHAMVFISIETDAGRAVCQRDIEKEVNLRPSATSTMLANLEKKGLLMRTVSSGDARTKYVCLTEKGKDACLKNKILMDKCDGIVQTALDENEQELLKSLLLKIMKEIEVEDKDD